jgi:hypothetical protein
MPVEGNETVVVRTEVLSDEGDNFGNDSIPDNIPVKSEEVEKDLGESNKEVLECNHGTQVGNECKCHDGWMTSEPEWSSDRQWCNDPASLTDDLSVAGVYMRSRGDAFAVLVSLINCIHCIEVRRQLPVLNCSFRL